MENKAYTSLALRDIPVPDYCDVVIVPTRGIKVEDPLTWAEAIFSHDNSTLVSRGSKALRDEAIRLFDLVPPPQKHRIISEVQGSEALIVDDSQSLKIRIGVAVEPGAELLRITTAVKYKNIAGRLFFGPRRMIHAATVHNLAKRAPITIRRQALENLDQSHKVGLLGVSSLKTQIPADKQPPVKQITAQKVDEAELKDPDSES